jgi:hypothetical protein
VKSILYAQAYSASHSVNFDSTVNFVNFLAGLINNLTLTIACVKRCSFQVCTLTRGAETRDRKHVRTGVAPRQAFPSREFTTTKSLAAARCARKAWAQLITPAQRAPCSQLVYHVEWITVRPFPHDAHFSLRHRRRHLRARLRLGSVRPGWRFTLSLSNSSGFNSRVSDAWIAW